MNKTIISIYTCQIWDTQPMSLINYILVQVRSTHYKQNPRFEYELNNNISMSCRCLVVYKLMKNRYKRE